MTTIQPVPVSESTTAAAAASAKKDPFYIFNKATFKLTYPKVPLRRAALRHLDTVNEHSCTMHRRFQTVTVPMNKGPVRFADLIPDLSDWLMPKSGEDLMRAAPSTFVPGMKLDTSRLVFHLLTIHSIKTPANVPDMLLRTNLQTFMNEYTARVGEELALLAERKGVAYKAPDAKLPGTIELAKLGMPDGGLARTKAGEDSAPEGTDPTLWMVKHAHQMVLPQCLSLVGLSEKRLLNGTLEFTGVWPATGTFEELIAVSENHVLAFFMKVNHLAFEMEMLAMDATRRDTTTNNNKPVKPPKAAKEGSAAASAGGIHELFFVMPASFVKEKLVPRAWESLRGRVPTIAAGDIAVDFVPVRKGDTYTDDSPLEPMAEILFSFVYTLLPSELDDKVWVRADAQNHFFPEFTKRMRELQLGKEEKKEKEKAPAPPAPAPAPAPTTAATDAPAKKPYTPIKKEPKPAPAPPTAPANPFRVVSTPLKKQ